MLGYDARVGSELYGQRQSGEDGTVRGGEHRHDRIRVAGPLLPELQGPAFERRIERVATPGGSLSRGLDTARVSQHPLELARPTHAAESTGSVARPWST